MPLISPTTLFVAGSINMTLSPAAFVWTMRTVAASSVSVAAAMASRAESSLVFMERHFKLRSHVVDPLFRIIRCLGPGARARLAGVDARLRHLQVADRAAL